MHLARCLMRSTEKGRAYGAVTAKALAVLEALLWAFHNAKSGLCYPGYEQIAEVARCARSTVAEALKALEDAGVLSWVQRIKRVREACPDLLGAEGWRWRVLRTSNTSSCVSLISMRIELVSLPLHEMHTIVAPSTTAFRQWER